MDAMAAAARKPEDAPALNLRAQQHAAAGFSNAVLPGQHQTRTRTAKRKAEEASGVEAQSDGLAQDQSEHHQQRDEQHSEQREQPTQPVQTEPQRAEQQRLVQRMRTPALALSTSTMRPPSQASPIDMQILSQRAKPPVGRAWNGQEDK
jgi:hypothetical protein